MHRSLKYQIFSGLIAILSPQVGCGDHGVHSSPRSASMDNESHTLGSDLSVPPSPDATPDKKVSEGKSKEEWSPSLSENEVKKVNAIPQIRDLNGNLSMRAYYDTLFGPYENENIGRGPWNQSYNLRKSPTAAQTIDQMVNVVVRCASQAPSYFASQWKALGPDDIATMKSLFSYYLGLVSLENSQIVPPRLLKVQGIDCNGNYEVAVPYSSKIVLTDLGLIMKTTPLFNFFSRPNSGSKVPNGVIDFLTSMRGSFGASLSDIFVLFIMNRYPELFGANDPAIISHLPANTNASILYYDKANNINGMKLRLQPPPTWNELGMYAYSSWGYGWWNSWIAKGKYEYPILTSLVPFVGAALDTLDAATNVYSGHDAEGRPTSRTLAMGLVALNAAFAALDVPTGPMTQGLYQSTKNQFRAILKRARSSKNANDIAPLVKEARELVAGSKAGSSTSPVDLGREATKAETSIGAPVGREKRFWNRSLGKDEETSKIYSEKASESANIIAEKLMSGVENEGKIYSYAEIQASLAPEIVKINKKGNKLAPGFGFLYDFADGADSITHFTAISSGTQYEKFLPMLERFAKQGARMDPKIHGDLVTGSDGWINQLSQTINLPDGTSFDVPLTIVAVTYDPKGVPTATLIHWWDNAALFSNHARYEVFEKVDSYLDSKLTLLRSGNLSRDEVIELVAEFHWWEANLTRYKRGSNGAADILSKALFKMHGMTAGMAKKEVSFDFWAFTHDLDQFKKIYRDLFEKFDGASPPDLTLKPAPDSESQNLSKLLSSNPPAPRVDGVAKFALNEASKIVIKGWAAEPSFSYEQGLDDDVMFGNQSDTLFSSDGKTLSSKIKDRSPPDIIIIKKVNSDGSEETIGGGTASKSSPADLPDNLKKLNKTNSGFEFSIDAIPNEIKVYAVSWLFPNEKKLIGEKPSKDNCMNDPKGCTGGKGEIGMIPNCSCTSIPASLTMESSDPNCNFGMFQNTTIRFQSTPAEFQPLNLGTTAFISTESFQDRVAGNAEFRYVLSCNLNQFTLTRVYASSPYGTPYRDGVLYSWLIESERNTCGNSSTQAFSLGNGQAFLGSDLTCNVRIHQ